MSDRKRHGFVLLLVLGLIAVSAVVIFAKPTLLGLDLKGGVQLVYKATPTAETPKVTQTALNQAVSIMDSRVNQLGVSQAQIQTEGGTQISASLPDVHDIARAKQEVGTTAQLFFFDWEANVLLPNGKTVASQLPLQNSAAITISQGTGAVAPGNPGTGGVPLYAAVKLASRQPRASFTPGQSQLLSRLGNAYYLFGAPGSAACKTAAADNKTVAIQGQHCLLSANPPDTSVANLKNDLVAGVSFDQGQVLTVPQGWVVVQASNPSSTDTIPASSANAQFFVLRDRPALTGKEIKNPQQGSDNGQVDVQFGFTSAGGKAFQKVTSTIAHRGALLSIGSTSMNQHFAAELDNQLLTVPQIDHKQFPDGIVNTGGQAGADITGAFTTQSAKDLATELRLGALPVGLKLISEQDVSATLGAQALHQGLVAGAAGLAVVMLFLIAYYRVLGVIATSTLIVYAIYFYALIKLIPITLSLAGIAGLILTIGVAADANIVIFERVKEEIRAGRSIRSGIATGYKKGLSAIIDANVVTILVAFILFVLSTQDVQGFAFTLGIGTVVSLFTAVLATQAILMTAGDTSTLARPSALGAGKPKRKITFDFMGASRYFFSMSGVILLVGALAIGGRGLNLGIDFTSGTRITTTLEHKVSTAQVSSTARAAGASNPVVQGVGKTGEKFQIAFKAGPQTSTAVNKALNARFGVKTFNQTSVGPTFGRTVTHNAIVAIIAALIVISLYVALRFDRKFTVPVLIALMHDLLITAGVYALVGRQVTVDTVAALLTILGYSLYDTIIVFDRVRENIPRMPRAAFSQIVNRSMSEVIVRSLATTSCTLLPIIALLIFGGSTLRDFAFALLVGVASGAYSSIFIASPVLTHWKEREPGYRHRRERIIETQGEVPAYAATAADVEPNGPRVRRRTRASLSEGDPGAVSAAEFEQLKRDIAEEEAEPSRHTSTLMRRMARTNEDEMPEPPPSGRAQRRSRAQSPAAAPPRAQSPRTAPGTTKPAAHDGVDDLDDLSRPPADPGPSDGGLPSAGFEHAPDEPENEGLADKPKRPPPKNRSRNRRHGRRR